MISSLYNDPFEDQKENLNLEVISMHEVIKDSLENSVNYPQSIEVKYIII
jgi:hypothetical protein